MKINKSMKYLIIFLIIIIRSISLYSQNNDNKLAEKHKIDHRQSNINLEFLSFSYSPSALFNSNMASGLEFQLGYGFKTSINMPSYKFVADQGQGWAYEDVKVLFEIAKIEPFLSYFISNNFYLRFGLYVSINQLTSGCKFFNAGIENSIYYGFRKIKIGHRFQFGNLFVRYNKYPEANMNVFLILLTPFVLQIKI